MASFDTTVRQMTEISQWPKCLSKKMTKMCKRKISWICMILMLKENEHFVTYACFQVFFNCQLLLFLFLCFCSFVASKSFTNLS